MKPSPRRPLLVLDLDETLLHATVTPLGRPPDFNVGPFAVYKRPHAGRFLAACATHFDLAVWTSAGEDYARSVLLEMAPEEVRFVFVWSRERCTRRFDPERREEVWVKDLTKVKKLGYPLERVLVVDDSPEKLARQYGNLVQVEPYFGDEKDTELSLLWGYLEGIRASSDYRRLEKRNWRVSSQSPQIG